MTEPRATFRLFWLVAFANCAALVGVCMTWVDRPVADFVNGLPRQSALFDWTARLLGSLKLVVASALLIIAGSAAWQLTRRGTPGWIRTLVVSAWSVMSGLVVAGALKVLTGRSQVYPPWIEHRQYGFHPFGGPGYQAFPSATMTAAGAMLSVVWLRAPRLRIPTIALLVLVGVAIIATNGHWVSDVVGGTFLGLFVGWSTVRLMDRRAAAGEMRPR